MSGRVRRNGDERPPGGGRRGAPRRWRAWRSPLLVAVTVALAGATAVSSARWREAVDVNRSIEALRAGRELAVAVDASPELLLAQIGFLTARDETDRARAYVEALDKSDSDALCAKGHYLLANALLRRAFDLIENGGLDAGGAHVAAAKREYRRALQFAPQLWDAKFNLDVAARLVRDFPEFERKSGDELRAEPQKLWTDAPGAPKGLP